MNKSNNHFCRSRALLFSISFICISFCWGGLANDLPIDINQFLEKNKDRKFDPSDPMGTKFFIGFRKSIRFEIEILENYSAIYQAINLKDYDRSHVYFPRSVLQEFQLPNTPLPDRQQGSDWEVMTRKIPTKFLPMKKQLLLSKFIIDYDMCFFYPIFELSNEFKEHHKTIILEARRERLEYLLLLSRYYKNDYPEYALTEMALLRASWVPDARAIKILEEAKQRIETDTTFYPSMKIRFQRRASRIDEMIELNAVIMKHGLSGALSEFRFAHNMRSSFTNADAISQFFSEFKTKNKEAKEIAIKAIKALALKHIKDPKNRSFKEQAADIVKGFRACLDRKTDIGKEATGISSYDYQDDWFPGKIK